VEIGGSGSLRSDINVTPLVDVMLVLLIIFMLVTPLLQKGVGVTLPEARNVAAVSENEDEVLMVEVTAGGQMFVAKEAVGRTRLEEALKDRLRSNPSLLLQLRADRNTQFKHIRDIVRAGREAGFGGISLIADEIKDQEDVPYVSDAATGRKE
jgi:biopolymer transport protein ExbD